VSLSKNTTTYEHFGQLKKYQVPTVFFDRIPDWPEAYCVSCNLENSSVQLTDLLVSRGHTRIGFIKGPDSIVHSSQRLEGYYEGLKKNKLAIDEALIVQTNLDRKSTENAMDQLLSIGDRPTAIITFNDYVALDAIRYTRDQGLKINKDIYFVSYANLPITSYLDDPPLASVEQFPYEQAEKATEILIRLIASQGNDASIQKKTVLESKVVVNVESR